MVGCHAAAIFHCLPAASPAAVNLLFPNDIGNVVRAHVVDGVVGDGVADIRAYRYHKVNGKAATMVA